MKADIGHIDNRRRISKEIDKVSSGKTGHCRIRKVQFILQFFFPVESTEKELHVFYDPNRNFRFLFLKTETPAMYRKRPAARNSKHQTLLSTLLAV